MKNHNGGTTADIYLLATVQGWVKAVKDGKLKARITGMSKDADGDYRTYEVKIKI